ncbi:hypothetical protein PSTT_12087 [Puccinia striiformis]|uniref:Uncharacterized protein n=1 Tax=Puccinia striiformis TaxID=27350 RepID=A0A2S4UXM7_9BASI|nr:hypothetical protein PSTT_12087 [Puccinia striiformis]
MCFGYRKIDMIKTPDNTLLRSILGSISTKKLFLKLNSWLAMALQRGMQGRWPPLWEQLLVRCGTTQRVG